MIVSDLEGTLLNNYGKVSSYTLSVLDKCKERAIKFVVATGWKSLNNDFVNSVNADYYILSNGCVIFDKDNEVIFDGSLSAENASIRAGKYWDKIDGINYLCKLLNISLSEVVSFGDSLNDTEMIRQCGMGIAVEDAIDLLFEYSKDTCGNCNEDGVAKWIENNILNK